MSVNMNGWRVVCLWLIVAKFIIAVKCTFCKENCNEIWTNGYPISDVIFSNYQRNNMNENIYIVNWQWSYNSLGKWSLYYKEWPIKEIQTGGFVLTIQRKQIAKLSWKINNGVLVWTSFYREAFEYVWNATICNLNLPIKFESKTKGWQFHLGEILLTGGKSGVLHLNGTNLLTSTEEEDLLAEDSEARRNKREVDDLSEDQKKTVWNRIKGYFRELFDQGNDDQRNWLRRIGDWLLGFLQRVLS